VVREERLRGPEGLAEPLTEAAPDALRLLAPGAAPAGTGDSAGFRGPGGLVAPVAAAAGARPPPVFLGDRLLTYTHRGARIYAVPTDRDLTPWLIERGEWEPHVERALRQLVRPGMCAADVGANVGYHTLTLAEIVGEDGRVFAFEADPFLAELVESTAAANGFAPRVHVAAKAVLDAPGEVVLAAASGHPGGGYVIRPQAAPAAPPARDRHLLHSIVPAVTLDSALAEVPALDLLRMDIEGAEPLALRGAAGLIDRSPHLAIVMEWSVAMMSRLADPGEAAAWLAARGFRFWRITGAPARNFETVPVAELTALPHCDLLAARQDPG
jgi:FkbM family methyltransferase